MGISLPVEHYSKSVVGSLKRIGIRKFQEHHVVDEKGQKTAVTIPVEEGEELLEDIHDLAVIAERRDESAIAFEGLKKKLRRDGLL